jgi:DNA-binding SARP family transcriptional activator/tetratricopeptide (TPR) repeat protein
MARTREGTKGSGAEEALEIRVLGELQVLRGGVPLALPPSKKTRALLAYLVLTRREHRRERLCELLWDVADDPRGALRWSLSKLRALVDDESDARIVAGREHVRFEAHGARVDAYRLGERLAGGVASLPTGELEELAAVFRGELLEGLDLGDFFDYQAWCVAERERARRLHLELLGALVERLKEDPARALPHARRRVDLAPVNESAHAELIRILGALGWQREAGEHVRAAKRLFRELGAPSTGILEEALEEGRQGPGAPPPKPAPPAPPVRPAALKTDLVGRERECERLRAALAAVAGGEPDGMNVLLLSGEPGIGKSSLLAGFERVAAAAGAEVFRARAFEAESGRPYGPWLDAFGDSLEGLIGEPSPESGLGAARERLFSAVARWLAARAETAPQIFVLDDLHWIDEASAALLHHVARTLRGAPALFVLAARGGELPDNEAALRLVRGLRREVRIEETELGPLSREAITGLLGGATPDAERIFADSGGNPLLALELARAAAPRGEGVPGTLAGLLRERVGRLPAETVDVLRWSAVLGDPIELGALSDLVSLLPEELLSAVETLERHALVVPSPDGAGHYVFAHDLVRRSVYGDLSEPRRRLMHARVAAKLEARGALDERRAGDLARHAALAGEEDLAARACVAAGRHCLRVFAGAAAERLAQQGERHVQSLEEARRVPLEIELADIACRASRPSSVAETAARIEALAERALDLGALEHARLGFLVVGWLRWETGDAPRARRSTLRAELVSRQAEGRERVLGVAEAARCLVLLDREHAEAGAMLLEAQALVERGGAEVSALADGLGMLHLHRGEWDEAARRFEHAAEIARCDGDHRGEFLAVEHLVVVDLLLSRLGDAALHARELERIGGQMGEGSESAFGRAVTELVAYGQSAARQPEALDGALAALREVDAKQRLAFVLLHAAEIELAAGSRPATLRARARATEALELAQRLERLSDAVHARALLAQAARAGRTAAGRLDAELEALAAIALEGVSHAARERARGQIEGR